MTRSFSLAPTLETPRLILRAHRPDDLTASASMWADETVTRFIGGRPLSREETWWRLLRYAGHWSWVGYGYWAVVEKSSGRFVGETGFADFQRDIELAFEGRPEVGWVLAPSVHGKGYATEASSAAIAWGDANLENPRTVCIIHPDHSGSIRVAQKHGYRVVQPTIYKDKPTVLFERVRP